MDKYYNVSFFNKSKKKNSQLQKLLWWKRNNKTLQGGNSNFMSHHPVNDYCPKTVRPVMFYSLRNQVIGDLNTYYNLLNR